MNCANCAPALGLCGRFRDSSMPNTANSPSPAMKAPDRIQRVCRDYRKLFASDEAMAAALGIELRVARDMLMGNEYPSLEVMILVQDALRKASIARPLDD